MAEAMENVAKLERRLSARRHLIGSSKSGGLLLAKNDNLEAVKVVEGGALGLGGTLLCPAGGSPLSGDVIGLECSLHLSESGIAGDVDPEVGE